MFFMCLNIFTELKSAMSVVVHRQTREQCTRAHGLGDPTLAWEHI